MQPTHHRCETLVIGAGLAGISTALELLERGCQVLLLDAAPHSQCGGQANDAFGGMLLCGTPEQRRNKVQDSPELLLEDWLRVAAFDADDHWGRRWAEHYAERNKADIYDWLRQRGVSFFPAVQWVERGNFGDGNALPRYHVAWGCGRGVAQTLARRMFEHAGLNCLFEHRVLGLETRNGAVVGCHGRSGAGDFRIDAEHVVVCSGGINGDLAKVRQHWDPLYGPYPENILNGTDPRADGELHGQVQAAGGQVVKLGRMWNYAAGIAHPEPQYPQHGLSLIPSRSALWLDASGQRIGPQPLVGGFDTHDQCKRIGHLPGQYGWQLLNWRIAIKELAISGTDSNPHFRDRKLLPLLWQLATGNRELVRWMVERCPDVLAADTLPQLAEKMAALAADGRLDPDLLGATLARYDAGIRRGPALYNDEQLRRLQQLRQWRGDRVRTCAPRPILATGSGPLIAIRTRLISRKSMGGMLTDLHSRVLDAHGEPLPGLYAAGEAAGFGGGGISGIRSLEGTFLSNCILNGRRAAQTIAGDA
ncbi:FAD-dependent oxidoreductase [Stutzerimonas stutzeri]|uniref:FAD-dependent oxidoreductase n=1 Tax=Stutzerimonas stutzeri TaxID=316 RepID=UPI00220CBA80|nr:FAD-dependent oxidoreductase [Stutzerimonas stutzeri]UVO16832.1 FAD-dependent oxidoreductase [Stutzerimonas stutzeri]